MADLFWLRDAHWAAIEPLLLKLGSDGRPGARYPRRPGVVARVPPMRSLIADKAFDANDVRAFLAAQGTAAVIPPMSRRLTPPCDPGAYRARNPIERAFCRRKDWRGIATRYDKTACNFLAGNCLAVAITDWLR